MGGEIGGMGMGGMGGSFMGGLGEGLGLPSFGSGGDMPKMGAPGGEGGPGPPGGDSGGDTGGLGGGPSGGGPGGGMGGSLTPGNLPGGGGLSGMGQHGFGSGAVPTTPPSTVGAMPAGASGPGNMPMPGLQNAPGTSQRLAMEGRAPGMSHAQQAGDMRPGLPPAGNIGPPGGGRLPPAGNIPPPVQRPAPPGPPQIPQSAPAPMRMAGMGGAPPPPRAGPMMQSGPGIGRPGPMGRSTAMSQPMGRSVPPAGGMNTSPTSLPPGAGGIRDPSSPNYLEPPPAAPPGPSQQERTLPPGMFSPQRGNESNLRGGPSSPGYAASSGERNAFGTDTDTPPQFGQQSDADRPTMDAEARSRHGGQNRTRGVGRGDPRARGIKSDRRPQTMRGTDEHPMATGYHPGYEGTGKQKKMEGKDVGSHDNPLFKIEDWAAGKADHVSVAGRKDQFGQTGTIPEARIGDETYKDAPFRVDDTGSQKSKFFGPSTHHLDLAHGQHPNASVSFPQGVNWTGRDPSSLTASRSGIVEGAPGGNLSGGTGEAAPFGGAAPPGIERTRQPLAPPMMKGGAPGFGGMPQGSMPPPPTQPNLPASVLNKPLQGPPPSGPRDAQGQLPYQTAPQRFQPPPGQAPIPGQGRWAPPSTAGPSQAPQRPAAPPAPPVASGAGGPPPMRPPPGGQQINPMPPGTYAGPMQGQGVPNQQGMVGAQPVTAPPPTPSPVSTGAGGPSAMSQARDPLQPQGAPPPSPGSAANMGGGSAPPGQAATQQNALQAAGRQAAQPQPQAMPPGMAPQPAPPAGGPPPPPGSGGPPMPPPMQPRAPQPPGSGLMNQQQRPPPSGMPPTMALDRQRATHAGIPQAAPQPRAPASQPRHPGQPPSGRQMPSQMTAPEMHQRLQRNMPNASHEQRLHIMNQNRNMLDPASRARLDQINQMRAAETNRRDFYPGGPNTGQSGYIGPMGGAPMGPGERQPQGAPTARSSNTRKRGAPSAASRQRPDSERTGWQREETETGGGRRQQSRGRGQGGRGGRGQGGRGGKGNNIFSAISKALKGASKGGGGGGGGRGGGRHHTRIRVHRKKHMGR